MPDGGFSTFHLSTLNGLKAFVESSKSCPPTCDRILLVEDISPPLVEILGTAFNCDPFFFESVLPWEYYRVGTRGSLLGSYGNNRLPSDAVYNDFLSVPFYRQSDYKLDRNWLRLVGQRERIDRPASVEEHVAYAWCKEYRVGKQSSKLTLHTAK